MEKKTLSAIIFLIFCILCSIMFLLTSASSQTGGTVYLEGLYATSVKTNYMRNGPHKLFDKMENTRWSSMAGAGPNEGIMLYFAKKTMIHSIQLNQPTSGNYNPIKRIQIVVNGTDIGKYYSPGYPIAINRKTDYIYIRIKDVEGVTYKKVTSDLRGFEKFETQYDTEKSVGLSEILLFGPGKIRLNIAPPKIISGSISASSTMEPEDAYHKDYLFDSKRDSGWVEGNEGSGKGENLQFKFSKSVQIRKIKIWNGLQNSLKHYLANARIRSFTFALTDNKGKTYKIRDTINPQTVVLTPKLTGRAFTMNIQSVYKGRSYKDCVVSEIRFHDGNSWFLLHSGYAEKLQIKKMRRIRNTILADIIDRPLGVKYTQDYGHKNISIILRSNNSFVIWIEKQDFDGQNIMNSKKVLDGFWEIKSLSGSKATIRILGRMFRVLEKHEPYRGDTKYKRVSIFSDTLTITKGTIRGKNYLGKISF